MMISLRLHLDLLVLPKLKLLLLKPTTTTTMAMLHLLHHLGHHRPRTSLCLLQALPNRLRNGRMSTRRSILPLGWMLRRHILSHQKNKLLLLLHQRQLKILGYLLRLMLMQWHLVTMATTATTTAIATATTTVTTAMATMVTAATATLDHPHLPLLLLTHPLLQLEMESLNSVSPGTGETPMEFYKSGLAPVISTVRTASWS